MNWSHKILQLKFPLQTMSQLTAIEEVTENPLPQAPIEEPALVVSESSEEEIQEMPEVENQEETFTETEEEVTLPNIFTPNNDGANDFFEINISEKQDFQIVVINHMNKVVFQSSSVDFRWDGMLPSGEPAPTGNYVYFISKNNERKRLCKVF